MAKMILALKVEHHSIIEILLGKVLNKKRFPNLPSPFENKRLSFGDFLVLPLDE